MDPVGVASTSASPTLGLLTAVSPPDPEQPRKRKRITLACLRCRQRKGRCDGVKPVCSNCAAAGVECQHVEPEFDGRKKSRALQGSAAAARLVGEEGGVGKEREVSQGEEDFSGHQSFDFGGTILARPEAHFSSHPEDSRFPAGTIGPTPAPTAPTPTPMDMSVPSSRADMEALVYDFCQGLANSSTPAAPAPQPPDSHVQFAPTVTSPISSREPPLSLHYHRPFGKSAIQPGLEQITIAIRAPPTFSRAQSPVHDSPSTSQPQTLPPQPDLASSSDLTSLDLLPHHFDPSTSHTSFPFGQPFADSPATVRLLFDEGSDVPRSDVLDVLYPTFFDKIGCQFPFLSLPSLQTLNSDDPSSQVTAPLLVLAVCALAARFSDDPLIAGNTPGRRLRATHGVPFADKAKDILVPLLAYPSSNTVAALLLLAWHEFGLNSEGALWMYSGMALRMAQDLGLHQDVHRHRKEVGEPQRASDTLLWWSCFILDRALAIGTGRSVTVKDNEISTPLPTSNDVALVSSPCTLPDAAPPPLSPFPFTVQFMLLYGKICEAVNLSKLPWRPFQPDSSLSPSQADMNDESVARTVDEDSPSEEAAAVFREIEDTITSTYLSLPPDMVFTSANFQRHAARGDGPTFLHLHLWYNCILILLYRPPLLFKKSRSSSLSLADRLAVVNNSCLTIGQLLSCAEIIDEYAYIASPFVNQCFFVAAGAWIQDFRIRTGRNIIATSSEKSGEKAPPVPNSSATILAQVALQNFNLCKNALDRQAEYWLGVGWIAALVDKQGMKQSRTSLQTATAGVDTFVSGEHATIRKQIGKGFAGARGVPPPQGLNDDSWMGMLLAAPSASASDVNMSADDMASFYTCTSMFPEIFGAEGQESLFSVQP